MKHAIDASARNARQDAAFISILVSATVFINLLVYAIVAYSIYNSHRHYDSLAEIATKNMATSIESTICGIFDKIDIGLSAVADEVERQAASHDASPGELGSYITRQRSRLPELISLFVIDSTGNLLLPGGGTRLNVADRDYFQRLRDNPREQLVVSGLIRGRISGKWVISLARRINRPDGSFGGVVTGGIETSYFEELFSRLDLGKHGAVGLRDMEFRLIALQPKGNEPGSQIGSNLISPKTREMTRLNPVTATYRTVFARDSRERMVTFRRARRYPLYVFATLAPHDYMAQWERETAIMLALTAVFTLATIISSRMISASRSTSLRHAETKRYAEEIQRQNDELNLALSRVKRLEGIIPICAYCKKIRTEQQSWEQLEHYFTEHSDALFSHGICPECAAEQMALFKEMAGNRQATPPRVTKAPPEAS
jgi:hypothetical protein